ncbi:MAG: polysaccharide deacetylase family protein [Cucumibacter sp.]
MRYLAYRAVFEALALTGLAAIVRPLSACKGAILTLHRVLPGPPAEFAPNAILQVTPDFLEAVILGARARGLDIVTLEEAVARIRRPTETRKFVVLTFDDACRDNLEHALPILRRHACPFTLYVPTGLVDGASEVWWQALEDIVAAQRALAVDFGDGITYLEAATTDQKYRAYERLYWHLREIPEPARVALIRDLAGKYGLDLAAHCRSLIMDWRELKTFVAEPLCTIGAHTVFHSELAKLSDKDMRREIAQSVEVLKAQYGITPRHLAYPIGSRVAAGPREFAAARELGFATAVTTRPGGLYMEHKDHLTALPRISLNGRFQHPRFIEVFLTGALFTALNGGRRLNID